jgi:arylsulfatase
LIRTHQEKSNETKPNATHTRSGDGNRNGGGTGGTARRRAREETYIVIIWGNDIGQSNISAYSHGLMGYQTPNIDRVAKEGMMFTDYYAEQSCTAGRASFITGQSGLRTEFLPTVHGFDEFYGNLYHLNAEEEPELPDYPKDPAFRARFGPRGVMDCKASGTDDPTVDPRFGKMGKQVCKDTGPLTKARMVGIDDDIAARAVDFIKRQNQAGKPAFVWVNFTTCTSAPTPTRKASVRRDAGRARTTTR